MVPGKAYCHACELWFDGMDALNSHVQWHYARVVQAEGVPMDEVEAGKALWRAMNAMLGIDDPPPADGVLRITLPDEDCAALEADDDEA